MKKYVMNKITSYHILLLILVLVIIYAPGLSGGFIFDDYINLKNIAVFSNFDGLEAFLRYVFSYTSGSLKRPISTLSFLMNSTEWPAKAFYFKLSNILIHLINSLLLLSVFKNILALYGFTKERAASTALLATAIWSFHPFFVSTTLYVVQRMAMLPVMFVLIGILSFIKGRLLYKGNLTKARIYLFLSVYGCTFLATLSKENGVVLVAILGLLEWLIISPALLKLQRKDSWLFLIIPITIVVSSFIGSIPHFIEGYGIRGFTMMERLFTEFRMLVVYLYHFIIPSYFTEGIFTDSVTISRSLIDPITTLISLLILLSMAAYAFVLRKRKPLYAFAIFFYLITNVIESSIVPLEIYFEHRGYLTLMFISLPIAIGVFKIKTTLIRSSLIAIIVIYLSVSAHFRSELWGNKYELIMQSADRYPQSVRVIENKAIILSQLNKKKEAIDYLEAAFKDNKRLSLAFNAFNLKCGLSLASLRDFDLLMTRLKNIKLLKSDKASLIKTIELLRADTCFQNSKALTLPFLIKIKKSIAYKNDKIKQVIDFYIGVELIKRNKLQESYQVLHDYLYEFSSYDDILTIIQFYMLKQEFLYAQKMLLDLEQKLQHIIYPKRNYNELINELKQEIYEKL